MSTGRQTIRASHLDKAFGQHDAELGKKMAQCLMEYHTQFVTPLEERLLWLEQPLYRRAILKAQAVWLLLSVRFSGKSDV